MKARGWPWFLVLFLAGAPASAGDPPNIVLAIADDLDPDHLGFCGNAVARTPHLDRLAAEGAYFPTLYAQTVCRPALATLLTGRWPHETGILNNQARQPLDPAGALPARLKERGYATYCGGKFWEDDLPRFGFDAPADNDDRFARNGDEGQDDLFGFLQEHAARGPWFVWWAPSLPHAPHRPPQRFAKAFAEVPIEVPADFRGDPAEYVDAERACLAMEAWLDGEFGHLIARLQELGELEETVILFLADNGWSTAGAAKGTPMEKGVRSPLVVRAPGAAPAGVRFDALVDLVDVHATVLDFAGAALPPGCRGRSLRPLLEGGAYEWRESLHGAAYTRDGRGKPEDVVFALYARDERWKYVLYLRDVASKELSPGALLASPFRRRGGKEELYDLQEDPLERVNLGTREEHAERLRDLRESALRWWRDSGGAELELPR